MFKTLAKRAAVTTMAVGACLLGAAGVSSAATLPTNALSAPVGSVLPSHMTNGTDDVPSLNLDAERFNCGGAALGYGAASLVSSAYLGVGTSVIDAGKYILTPDSIHFVNHGSGGSMGIACHN